MNYPPDGKVGEGKYKDDRKVGVWIKYHTDGKTPKLKGTYENNRPTGHYQKFYKDGTLLEEGFIDLSRPVDRSTLGRVRIQTKCDFRSKGVTFGSGQVFDQYGNPIIPHVPDYTITEAEIQPIYLMDTTAKTGEAQFLMEIYPVQDDTLRHYIGKAGENKRFSGYHMIYDENDEIFIEGNFKDCRFLEGKIYEYDEDGILLRIKVYNNGRYAREGEL